MTRAVWPTAREYAEAIVDPTALGDAGMETAVLQCRAGGRPIAYRGAFTTTFHFETATGGVAFRCYTRGNDDIERRYTAIAELLRYVRNSALCDTTYVSEAIRVGDMWWPAVKMEWLAGRRLNAEIETRLQDSDGLLALAENFREVVRSLGVLGVAHGDLQHGNIFVEHDCLRLIDYDAMYLPAVAGFRQTEYGHRNYQHPQRRRAPFDGRLDRFSSIVIYTALVALSADRTLWRRFNDGENLLFRAHDFTSNGSSELFRTLLVNNAASGLADALLAACRTTVERVPTLEQVIRDAAGTMRSPVASVKAAALYPVATPPRLHETREHLAGEAATVDEAEDVSEPEPDETARPLATPRPSGNGFARSIGLGALAAVIAGLGAGFGIAAWQHRAVRPTVAIADRSVAAVTTAAATAVATPAPMRSTLRTAAPAAKPAVTIMSASTPSPSPSPTAKPTPTPTKPSATPSIASTAIATAITTVGHSALQGTWQINEANLEDGTMVWSGDAAVSGKGTIVLNAHKVSVAGRPATACELRTNLHAAVALGVAQQSVPFQEVNCQGTTSSGEVRVADFSRDARSFHGSFWSGSVKLGDFEARKQ